MKLPRTLAQINAALAARHAGLSVEVIGVKPQGLCDERVGPFMRFRFTLHDGDVFHVDSLEMSACCAPSRRIDVRLHVGDLAARLSAFGVLMARLLTRLGDSISCCRA